MPPKTTTEIGQLMLIGRDGKQYELSPVASNSIDLKPHGKPYGDISPLSASEQSISFDIPPTPENQKSMQELIDMCVEDVKRQIAEWHERVEDAVIHICQNYVTPPIKGKITKDKIKRRGLSLAFGQDAEGNRMFYGVIQRGTLILRDGKKVKLSNP